MKHQVASVDILHHEEQPVLWGKQALELTQSEKIDHSFIAYGSGPKVYILSLRLQKYGIFTGPGFNTLLCVISFIKHFNFQKPNVDSLFVCVFVFSTFCLQK